MFKRFGYSFTTHDQNQHIVVSWERNTIKFFYPCSGNVFSLKIRLHALQSSLIKIFSLKLFSFVVCSYYMLHCIIDSVILKLLCYVILLFSLRLYILFSFIYFILFYFSNKYYFLQNFESLSIFSKTWWVLLKVVLECLKKKS